MEMPGALSGVVKDWTKKERRRKSHCPSGIFF